MPIPFNTIPSGGNLRLPLFYAENDNSQANVISLGWATLLIGHKLSSGFLPLNTVEAVSTVSAAKYLFGAGSMLARMVEYYRLVDPSGLLFCVAIADPGAGVAATGTITVTGPSTAAGTINLYIAGQRVQVNVGIGDSANTIATSINAAINAATDLPLTSTAATNVVTMTCRWKGLTGNDINIRDSYRGWSGGETLPSGVSLACSGAGFLAGGTGSPTFAGAPITAMGDEQYDFVIHPFSDSASLDALQTELNDTSGRWSYIRQLYGHCYTAQRGTYSDLLTVGGLRNDQHNTLDGFETLMPTPSWEFAASFGGRNAGYISIDPARPTHNGELVGVLPPPPGSRFIFSERNALAGNGIAVCRTENGRVVIDRAVTTYQKNSLGQADTSYLDSETMHTTAYVLRYLRAAITSKYARQKLANDGTRFDEGSAVVTPSVAYGEIVSAYGQLERQGIVENTELFKKYLIVERPATNPNRLDVLFPPDYVNQLRVFAVLNQFRLQYPASAIAA